MKKNYLIKTIILVCILVSFFAIKTSLSKGGSTVEYYECNKKEDVNSAKVLEKFGASETAWDCFVKRIEACSPTIIYGEFSRQPKNIPIYYSIYGKNADGDCIITGPLYDKETKNVKGNSCLLTASAINNYKFYYGPKSNMESVKFDYNFVVTNVFRGHGQSCTGNAVSANGQPYCLLSLSNPDLKKCSLYFDPNRYQSSSDFKTEPTLLTDEQVLQLPKIEAATKYEKFTPLKYTYQNFEKAYIDGSSTGLLIEAARASASNDSFYKSININDRELATEIIKKNVLLTMETIDDKPKDNKKTMNVSEKVSAYLDLYGEMMKMNMSADLELLNRASSTNVVAIDYGSIYPFAYGNISLAENSVCYKDGAKVTNGLIDANGDIVYLGYYCVNSTTNEITQKYGYLWNEEVFKSAK